MAASIEDITRQTILQKFPKEIIEAFTLERLQQVPILDLKAEGMPREINLLRIYPGHVTAPIMIGEYTQAGERSPRPFITILLEATRGEEKEFHVNVIYGIEHRRSLYRWVNSNTNQAFRKEIPSFICHMEQNFVADKCILPALLAADAKSLKETSEIKLAASTELQTYLPQVLTSLVGEYIARNEETNPYVLLEDEPLGAYKCMLRLYPMEHPVPQKETPETMADLTPGDKDKLSDFSSQMKPFR